MSSVPQRRDSEADYLVVERGLETKHEFYQGEMFAMSGASRDHNQISFNLALCLGSQLRDRPCTGYIADMRVKVAATGLYTYPDALITCEPPKFEDDQLDTLLNPQVILEILSDSTEKYDRGKKFEHYRQIPSLREYVLISQDHAHVERFLLDENGHWVLSEVAGSEGTLTLVAVECQVPLADLYAKVTFDQQDAS
jgi:Uma2 family endonuclease